MKRSLASTLAALALAASAGSADSAAPFKLGSFERDGRTFVGVVLRDAVVIDLAAADAALPGPRLAAADMKDVIARYESAARSRIRSILAQVDNATSRPAYVMDLAGVRTRPPILYPTTMLNAAVNYREHGVEMANRSPSGMDAPGAPAPGTASPGTKSIAGIWNRADGDARWNPYLFVKLPSAVIASGEPIVLPPGRTRIDWECELGIVIGRETSHVDAKRAAEHIFGYTLENDVSDREPRGDGRHGSDWLIAKSHDTFAPMGPFLVPKEFVPDPQKLAVRFTLNGQLMQDGSTAAMIHNVFELVAYASHITTLRPGDVIASGTPPGVGSGRTPPVFLKAGDEAVCTYEGIGTLKNPVASAH